MAEIDPVARRGHTTPGSSLLVEDARADRATDGGQLFTQGAGVAAADALDVDDDVADSRGGLQILPSDVDAATREYLVDFRKHAGPVAVYV